MVSIMMAMSTVDHQQKCHQIPITYYQKKVSGFVSFKLFSQGIFLKLNRKKPLGYRAQKPPKISFKPPEEQQVYCCSQALRQRSLTKVHAHAGAHCLLQKKILVTRYLCLLGLGVGTTHSNIPTEEQRLRFFQSHTFRAGILSGPSASQPARVASQPISDASICPAKPHRRTAHCAHEVPLH